MSEPNKTVNPKPATVVNKQSEPVKAPIGPVTLPEPIKEAAPLKPSEPMKQHDNTAELQEHQDLDTTRKTVGEVENVTSNKIINPTATKKVRNGGLVPDGKGGRKWVSIEEEAAYLQQKADRETMNKR